MTRAPAGGTARRVPVRCAGAHARAVPALLRRARRTLGVLALALPAFVALLPPTSAQAQSVSVSNIAKAKSQHVGYLTSSFAVANALHHPRHQCQQLHAEQCGPQLGKLWLGKRCRANSQRRHRQQRRQPRDQDRQQPDRHHLFQRR